MADSNLNLEGIFKNSNLALASMVILILGIMILPLPSFLMDVLLVMNIMTALIMLFVALYIQRPLEFSVFPGLLLIVTLFRLSLNVATTRLILSQGFAGEIINSFGSFVVQGNYVVGVVIFLILIIINFIVITKGATRIAEVTARFTLDAMPGKQMAIDADLNAGLIDDREAQTRRLSISKEADFYGAMDGAAKFVRGDAIAGLLITMVNILGGLSIGVFQRGMQVGDAASTYMLLTIGDGLVSQIPALIISTASGMIIARASSSSSMGIDIASQISGQPKALYVTSGVLGILALIPGLPFWPFIIMGGLLSVGNYMLDQSKKAALALSEKEEEAEAEPEVEEKIEDFLHPDPFEVEIGYGLISLVDVKQGGNLLDRISAIRKSLAMELGVIVPPIRIRDNIQLKSNQYSFKIYGIEAATGEVMLGNYLLLNPDKKISLRGIRTTEPTFGLPAMWIADQDKEKAEMLGYSVIEVPAIISTHLMEVLKNNAHKLLDRQETQRMLDHLKKTRPALVEGIVPDQVSLGTVTQILKNLLAERIPVRNLVNIMSTIADYGQFTKDADVLTDYVRTALAETITDHFKQNMEQLTVATLDPMLEDRIMESVKESSGRNANLRLNPSQINKLFEYINEKVEKMLAGGSRPILLVSPQIRRAVKNLVSPVLPNLSVLSYTELTPDTNLNSVGAIQYPNEA